MDKPEILVVEDEQAARTLIANELQGQGARVLIAENDTQALDIFYRHASTIDAVVTDMRLRSKRKDDHSGGNLGQKLKQIAPGLPVYCNSAIDVRKLFPFFEQYFIKGSGSKREDIYQNIPEIVEKAITYENARYAEVPDSLIRLKQKYQISDTDFFELVGSRRLSEFEQTALLLLHRALENAEGAMLGEPIPVGDSGAEISFVEPGAPEASDVPLRKAVPIVVEKTGDIWVAELFGFPLIYTYADQPKDAIENLLTILLEYRDKLAKDDIPSERVDMDYVRFSNFLKLLFV